MAETRKPSFWQVTKSVLAGAIGVQSEKNRKADFQSHSIWPFVLGGVLFTALFVVILIAIVLAVS